MIRCLVASHGASVPLPLFWNSLIVHIASVKPARRQIAPTINLQRQPSPHCQPERYNRIAGIKTHTVTGNAKIALTTLKFKDLSFIFFFLGFLERKGTIGSDPFVPYHQHQHVSHLFLWHSSIFINSTIDSILLNMNLCALTLYITLWYSNPSGVFCTSVIIPNLLPFSVGKFVL